MQIILLHKEQTKGAKNHMKNIKQPYDKSIERLSFPSTYSSLRSR